MKKLYFLMVLMLIFTGCGKPQERIEKYYFDHIYMHEMNLYSFSKIEGNEVKSFRASPYWCQNTKVFQDLPKEEKMWVEVTTLYGDIYGERAVKVEIHIHDANEIGTAGWNHGKFGSGQTTKIE